MFNFRFPSKLKFLSLWKITKTLETCLLLQGHKKNVWMSGKITCRVETWWTANAMWQAFRFSRLHVLSTWHIPEWKEKPPMVKGLAKPRGIIFAKKCAASETCCFNWSKSPLECEVTITSPQGVSGVYPSDVSLDSDSVLAGPSFLIVLKILPTNFNITWSQNLEVLFIESCDFWKILSSIHLLS